MKNILFLLLLLILSNAKVNAQNDTLPLYEIKNDAAPQFLDNSYYEVLEDKARKWTIDDVITPALQNKFHSRSVIVKGVDTIANTYWFRYRLKNVINKEIKIFLNISGDMMDYYVFEHSKQLKHFTSGEDVAWSKKDGYKEINAVPVTLQPAEEVAVYCRIHNVYVGLLKSFKIGFFNEKYVEQQYKESAFFPISNIHYIFFLGIFLLAGCFNISFYLISRERVYLYLALWLFYLCLSNPAIKSIISREYPLTIEYITPLTYLWHFFFFLFIRQYFQTRLYMPRWDKLLVTMGVISLVFPPAFFYTAYLQYVSVNPLFAIYLIINPCLTIIDNLFFIITPLLFVRRNGKLAKSFLFAILPLVSMALIYFLMLSIKNIFKLQLSAFDTLYQNIDFVFHTTLTWAVLSFSWALFRRYDQQKKEIAMQALNVERLAMEKEMERSELIAKQKEDLEKTVDERTAQLKHSLEELKSTQAQLIQSEKMASLGELTAGIAHEIQNPLNFVNNFSEVNTELIEELKSQKSKVKSERDEELEGDLLNDIAENEQKINHHGKRADAIVKGMLQHSRASTGKKEPTDINALTDEYLRLSYHGLRAKDKSFNATIETHFDESIGKIEVIPQDIGRVLLNLFNNAFYAVTEKKKQSNESYGPTVSVSTKRSLSFGEGRGEVIISVKDNGIGIPQKAVDKIFQPFFTTKPTGQGTGLGLSLSYDIIKAHGGEIKVETKEGKGTEFIIQLPIQQA